MKTYLIPVVVVALGITAMVSGKIDINFHHNLNLPPEISNPNQAVTSYNVLTMTKKVDVYFRDSVKNHRQIQDVIQLLNQASSRTTIVIHLAGYGGNVESYEYLSNSIKSSKATVVMSVDAPVYSGHAYLALSGHKLVMSPYSYLMFHASSALDIDCNKKNYGMTKAKIQDMIITSAIEGYDPDGLDRGVSKKTKCIQFKAAHLYNAEKMLNQLPYLTNKEKTDIIQGGDVYIQSDDPRFIKNRSPDSFFGTWNK